MAKASGPRRADGKVLKPEGWTPPDIVGVLERQAKP
jgi:predicted HAD superfamily Cof-like phosphohydrolase